MSVFKQIHKNRAYRVLALFLCLFCAYPALGLPTCCEGEEGTRECCVVTVEESDSCCSSKPEGPVFTSSTACCCEVTEHQVDSQPFVPLRITTEDIQSDWTPSLTEPDALLPVPEVKSLMQRPQIPVGPPQLSGLCRLLL